MHLSSHIIIIIIGIAIVITKHVVLPSALFISAKMFRITHFNHSHFFRANKGYQPTQATGIY